MNNLDANDLMRHVSRPGHYNDPDLLQVGNIGLTYIEQVSHFSLWCLITGPLLISTDLDQLSNKSLKILTNAELIAINQDVGGRQGVRVSPVRPNGPPGTSEGLEIWAKPLANGSLAVVLLNRSPRTSDMKATWAELGLPVGQAMAARDIFNHKDFPTPMDDQLVVKAVPSHGTVSVKLTPM